MWAVVVAAGELLFPLGVEVDETSAPSEETDRSHFDTRVVEKIALPACEEGIEHFPLECEVETIARPSTERVEHLLLAEVAAALSDRTAAAKGEELWLLV